MELIELLDKLGEKTGLKDNPDFQMMRSASALKEVQVPDDLGLRLSGLLSEKEAIEAAKNNLTVKTHYQGVLFSGLREKMVELLSSKGFTGEEIAEVNSLKNVTEIYQKALDLAGSKKGRPSQEAERMIAELQTQLKETQNLVEQKVGETRAQYNARLKAMKLKDYANSFKWSDGYNESLRGSVYETAVHQVLNELGADAQFDDDSMQFRLVQKADPTLKFTKEGKELSFDDLHSLTLQKFNLLASATPGGGNPASSQGAFQRPASSAGGESQSLDKVTAMRLSQIDKFLPKSD